MQKHSTTDDDEIRARVARLEILYSNAPAPYPSTAQPQKRRALGIIFDMCLIALAIVGAFALAQVFVWPSLTAPPQTTFSTSAVLPTAVVRAQPESGPAAGQTMIIEATFPPPVPASAPAGADIAPTDAPAPTEQFWSDADRAAFTATAEAFYVPPAAPDTFIGAVQDACGKSATAAMWCQPTPTPDE